MLEIPPIRTSFVGRTDERRRLIELLLDNLCPLIAVVGAGGVGKTRLVLRVLDEIQGSFAGGIVYVPLAVVRGPEFVAPAILHALGVPEPPTGATVRAIVDALQYSETLLVLDNFEHVVGAAPLLAELLAECPDVRILVTSRVRLRIGHETLFQLDPLPVPRHRAEQNWEELATFESVELFVQRAQEVNPGFMLTALNAADVADICIRLDGLPLAIELAAARTRVIAPDRIRQLLDAHIPILTGGPVDAPERLRTMQAAIEWSYQLLDGRTRGFFRRLAIFIGGWDIDGASAVISDVGEVGHESGALDHVSLVALGNLESLIDHSMLRRSDGPAGIPRFTMLETLREFGLEELRRHDELEETSRLHTQYCIELATQGTRELSGPNQSIWLSRLDVDYPNMRAALERCLQERDGRQGIALCNAIAWYWRVRGLVNEANSWFESFLVIVDRRSIDQSQLASALRWRGELLGLRGDMEVAETQLGESLALFRDLGDTRGIAGVLSAIGIARTQSGFAVEAVDPFLESAELHRSFGDLRRVSFFEAYAALGIGHQGDYARAQTVTENARRLAVSVGGNRSFEVAFAELVFAVLAVYENKLEEAVPHIELSLSISEELSSLLIVPTAYANWARVEIGLGRPARAVELMQKGFPISVETGFRLATGMMVSNLVSMAVQRQQWRHAAFLLGVLDQLGTGYRTLMVGARWIEWENEVLAIEGKLDPTSYVEFRRSGARMPITVASFDDLVRPLEIEMSREAHSLPRLSRREREVLHLIASGLSDREIADQLSISRPTASKHVSAILAKLGVRTRAAAAALARQVLNEDRRQDEPV